MKALNYSRPQHVAFIGGSVCTREEVLPHTQILTMLTIW